jgi:hypothetical protein
MTKGKGRSKPAADKSDTGKPSKKLKRATTAENESAQNEADESEEEYDEEGSHNEGNGSAEEENEDEQQEVVQEEGNEEVIQVKAEIPTKQEKIRLSHFFTICR